MKRREDFPGIVALWSRKPFMHIRRNGFGLRKLKILNRGKQPAIDISTDHLQIACLLVPERGRLAPLMTSDAPLSPTQMWLATRDLSSLCVQAFNVLYLPGRQPAQSFCPAAQCKLNLTK
jgi:hypothetical protein